MTKLASILIVSLASLSLLESSEADQRNSLAFVGHHGNQGMRHADQPHVPMKVTRRRQGEPSSSLFLDGGRMNQNSMFASAQTSSNSEYHHHQSTTTTNGKKSSTELSFMSSREATLPYPTTNVKLYCDMDGVLCDFEGGVKQLVGLGTADLIKGTMWKHISRADAFYENLNWTRDGRRLWNAIRKLKPDILTGVPYHKSSRIEKFNWCRRELGIDRLHHVDKAAGCNDHESVNGNAPMPDHCNVITCWSNNKWQECTHRA